MAKHLDDPKTAPTAIVTVVFTILVAVTVILLQAFYGRSQDRAFAEKTLDTKWEEREQLTAEQRATLHSYAWADRDSGFVRLPIDRAMELVAAELGGGGSQ